MFAVGLFPAVALASGTGDQKLVADYSARGRYSTLVLDIGIAFLT